MRCVLPLAASVAICLSALPAFGDDKSDCASHKDQEFRLAACSKLISASPADAAAYRSRGLAYVGKGDIDKAITDFDKAIDLNPRFAAAYDSRGQAWVRKGDYTRAVADVTKANELAPKVEKAPTKTTGKAAEASPKAEKAPIKPAGKTAEPPARKPVARVGGAPPMAKVAVQEAWPAWALRVTD